MFNLNFVCIDLHLTSPHTSHISLQDTMISCSTEYLNNTANSRLAVKTFDRPSVSNNPGENFTFYLEIYFCVCYALFETLPYRYWPFQLCFFILFILRDYVH